MNTMYLISGLLAFGATIGHFVIGYKDFLKPVLDSQTPEIPKQVMRSLFHYMSAFQIFSSTCFLMGAFYKLPFSNENLLMLAIAYALFGIVQIYVALTSGIKGGLFKLFQWVVWVLIAGFAFLG